jgi:4-hydroxybenzoate polyprenyltransferase
MLSKVKLLLRLTRPVNLFIIALTQALLKYCVLDPLCHDFGMVCLPEGVLFLLIASTVFTAASGNLYNDLQDLSADRINRPGKQLITDAFSWLEASMIWKFMMIAGVLMAVAASLLLGTFMPAVIVLLSSLGLIAYSRWLKARMLWGNVLVSLLVPASILLIIIASAQYLADTVRHAIPDNGIMQPPTFSTAWIMSGFFMFFAFISTFIREIIKDFQDIPGDRQAAYRTMAMLRPRMALRFIIWGFFFLHAGMAAFAAFLSLIQLYFSTFWLLLLMLYSLFLMFNVRQLMHKEMEKVLSRRLKWFMLAGILTMVILWIEWNGFGLPTQSVNGI